MTRPAPRAPASPLARAVLAGLAALAVLSAGPVASARPKKPALTAEQKQADRHFKNGVALYQEGKFAEALAEFERAHEIAPHPLVLYNIAATYRELSRYGEAVRYYGRFLSEAEGVAPPARLAAARKELDEILGRVARVSIAIEPAELAATAALEIDGTPIDAADLPAILPPGEHRVTARAEGRVEAVKTVRVASGDEVTVALALAPAPPEVVATEVAPAAAPTPADRAARRRFAVAAGGGTNLLRVGETGAPTLGMAFAIGGRVELGLDVLLVAYAAVPSVRLRLLGDRLSLHAALAAPVSFGDGEGAETFVAGAAGLALRYRASAALALRLEGFASYAGAEHGTTVPAFVGGEMWF